MLGIFACPFFFPSLSLFRGVGGQGEERGSVLLGPFFFVLVVVLFLQFNHIMERLTTYKF